MTHTELQNLENVSVMPLKYMSCQLHKAHHSDSAIHFSDLCDIYKAAKMVHINKSCPFNSKHTRSLACKG